MYNISHSKIKDFHIPAVIWYIKYFTPGSKGNTGSRNGRFAVFGGPEELLGNLRAAHQRGEEENTEEVEIWAKQPQEARRR